MSSDLEIQIQNLINQKDTNTKEAFLTSEYIDKLRTEMVGIYQNQLFNSLYSFENSIRSKLSELSFSFSGKNGDTFISDLNSDLMYRFLLDIAQDYKNKVL